MKNILSFLAAMFLFAAFWVVMLATGMASRLMVIIIGSLVFLMFTIFSIKKKSFGMLTVSILLSTSLFYSLWGISFLIGKAISWIRYLMNNFFVYFKSYFNLMTDYLKTNDLSWLVKPIKFFLFFLLALIIFSLVKKNWKKILTMIVSVWRYFSGLYVIVGNDEAHVVTRIDGGVTVYSGTDISGRSSGLGSAYQGNHYWDFSQVGFLKMIFGMKIQTVRFDDLKKEIKDTEIKSKDNAKLIIGRGVFHFRVYNPLTASKVWPGQGMDVERFKASIDDIVEEAIEISVKKFTAEELTGGSLIVNEAFREALADKLEDNYGIKIINAKLSQESGEVIDLITQKEKEQLRAEAELAKQQAEQKIELAKKITQLAVNAKNLAKAEGEKAVISKAAEAEALRIAKILEAQGSNMAVFNATNPLAAQIEVAKALAKIYANATTIVNSGSSDLIGNLFAVGKALGVEAKSIKTIASN